jgi:hypothetical protein
MADAPSSSSSSPTKRAALATIVLSTLMIGAGYAAVLVLGRAPAWAPWCFMIGTSTVMLGTIVLGAARGRSGVGRLAFPFLLIYALLLAGFGSVLVMPAETGAGTTLWLGLPPRAAIVLYGIGILPLFLLPLAYAWTFDAMTLSEEDLARVAAARPVREAAGTPPAPGAHGEAA